MTWTWLIGWTAGLAVALAFAVLVVDPMALSGGAKFAIGLLVGFVCTGVGVSVTR